MRLALPDQSRAPRSESRVALPAVADYNHSSNSSNDSSSNTSNNSNLTNSNNSSNKIVPGVAALESSEALRAMARNREHIYIYI